MCIDMFELTFCEKNIQFIAEQSILKSTLKTKNAFLRKNDKQKYISF